MGRNSNGWLPEHMDEVVGLEVNDVIYGGFRAIHEAHKNGNNFTRYITRAQASVMAQLDLGVRWDRLSECPTILIVDKKGARLPDGMYTNDKQEIFEIKDGIKTVLERGQLNE